MKPCFKTLIQTPQVQNQMPDKESLWSWPWWGRPCPRGPCRSTHQMAPAAAGACCSRPPWRRRRWRRREDAGTCPCPGQNHDSAARHRSDTPAWTWTLKRSKSVFISLNINLNTANNVNALFCLIKFKWIFKNIKKNCIWQCAVTPNYLYAKSQSLKFYSQRLIGHQRVGGGWGYLPFCCHIVISRLLIKYLLIRISCCHHVYYTTCIQPS